MGFPERAGAAGPAVAVQGLERRFGDLVAVAGLDFEVMRGEMFGIVGPDGAGKTTLLRLLAGVLRPTGGDARVAGRSIAKEPEAVKHHAAYMAQRFGLYEDLTIRENIDFYADLYHVPRAERPERMDRLFRFSQLGPFQDRLVGQLSGGMKQKASLSCALIHHPDILLLDEPTFGVDPISRRDLWLILHEMVADGVTVIVTTSYLDEAERCDRVALLDHGRALATGPPAELLRGYPGRMYAVGRADRELRDRLRAMPGVRQAYLFGDTIHVRFTEGAVPDAGALEQAGVRAGELTAVTPSLEDLFLTLTDAGATNG
jgi:ABC-2 type transport system ATP-binding protein